MKACWTFILCFCCYFISAQNEAILVNENFIPNGGFESYYNCPGVYNKKTFKHIDLAVGWNSPTMGTPDYFNSCGKIKGTTPADIYLEPKFGDGFAGIITWKPNKKDALGGPKGWREYIAIVLKKPLVKDQKYLVKMWYVLSPLSQYYCHDIGMLFSDEVIVNYEHMNTMKEITMNHYTKKNVDFSQLKPCVSNDKTDTTNLYKWKKFSQVFTAKGGERYLYIGNFKNNDESNYGKVTTGNRNIEQSAENAYYLIDNISTQPYIDIRIKRKKMPGVGESFQLNNIYFKLDSYELMPSTERILDKMKQIFVDYKGLAIEIQGHTDDYGSKEYNINLSHYRARAIYNYLVKIGCPKSKMTYKGYGESKPLAPNTSDKNRELNRRVEFKVLAR
tara:strand:- start:4414 stop:5583 length:1170 start_codon:yes stop_codon:yes gene_type:complete